MDKITVAVSGGFDPLHIGHLELFQRAKALGNRLVVIVNSDRFLLEKKGYYMMPLEDRLKIIRALSAVDEAVPSIDGDNTVVATLRLVKPDIFANGGDRTEADVAEDKVCRELGCEQVFGLGKKIRSSSSYGMVK